MKKTSLKSIASYTIFNVVAAGALLATIGCELSDSGDSSRNTLEISPRNTNILTQAAALFTVTTDTNVAVVLPLVWSVDDPSLGTIVSAAGQSAVYRAGSRSGVNTITVRDQGDKSGLAQITISEPEIEVPVTVPIPAPVEEEPAPTEPAGSTVNIILPDTTGGSTTP